MDTTDITDAQIETLRTEAGEAGDDLQVALCDIALGGAPTRRGQRALLADYPALASDETPEPSSVEWARAECERVIAEGQG